MKDFKELRRLICQHRKDGLTYEAIARKLQISHPAARHHALKALQYGETTATEIGLVRENSIRNLLTPEQYNEKWWARFRKHARPGQNGCIEMPTVFHNVDGYAHLYHRDLGNFAHRIVVILKGREIPTGFMACHSCGNHGCVNDEHLYVGTMKQNARDTVNHGRHLEANKTHCIHGHPFDEENTRICKRGKRHCKACEKIVAQKPGVVAWRRAYQAKRRALKRAGKLGEVSP